MKNDLIKVTEAALNQLRKAVEEARPEPTVPPIPDTTGIRIGLRGGGCSGFMFSMDLEEVPAIGDVVLEFDGVTIYIDPISAPYMDGITLDYISTLTASGFKFTGGKISRTCGCGQSAAF